MSQVLLNKVFHLVFLRVDEFVILSISQFLRPKKLTQLWLGTAIYNTIHFKPDFSSVSFLQGVF